MHLNLGPENYSPALLDKIVHAGGNESSFHDAADRLARLADLDLSESDVWKFTVRIGGELQALRDRAVDQYNRTGEVDDPVPNTPPVAAVSVDGGRVQMRAEAAGRGVHQPRWREPRYGSLLRLSAPKTDTDPHPEVPRAFLDEAHVRALTDEIHSPCRGGRPKTSAPHRPPKPPADPPSPKPERLVETCVASMAPAEEFGALVAAEARRRQFHKAPQRGFLGDGQPSNWTIQEFHFPDWTPILDFIHLLTYLFTAARAARPKGPSAWTLYVRLVTAAWRGEAHRVLALLTREAQRLGDLAPDTPADDPRRILQETLRYVRNNLARMDYPAYRAGGLPVTTCFIESLVKRFNRRVKASDKFWVQPSLEAVLQVRAACLSEDQRWEKFWLTRSRRLAAASRPYRARAS